MRLGLKLFLATALAAVLVVPAAGAKPGNGGGKPSWAGQPASQGGGGNGNAGAKAKGKPSWAGQGKAKAQAKKAENAQRKLERRAAAAADEPAEGEEQEGPLKDNPAFVCKFERDMMGAQAFADEYGTNENDANAFGKCVSEQAHARDSAAEGGDQNSAEASVACEPTGEEPVDGEEPAGGEEPAQGDEPADEPAEGECPDDEGTDSGEAGEEGSEEQTEEGSEEDGSSSTEQILAALRLLF